MFQYLRYETFLFLSEPFLYLLLALAYRRIASYIAPVLPFSTANKISPSRIIHNFYHWWLYVYQWLRVCGSTFDDKIFTLVLQFPNLFWKFRFLPITFISEWHSIIVIIVFKFILRRPKAVLSWIWAVYLCLIYKTLLEAVPVHWTACFVSAITHLGWLFEALEK